MGVLKSLGLRTKMITGSLAPLVLVVALGVVVYLSVNSLLTSSHMVDHTHTVIQEAMKIEGSAVDMETGMRGYLLAGQDGFLDPYTGGNKRFDKLVAGLQKTVNDNPAQVQRLNDIRDNIKAWQKDVTEPTIDLRRKIGQSKTMDDMRDLVRQKKGKEYMDGMRAKIATFIEREAKLMEARKAAAKRVTDIDELKETYKWVEHTHKVIGEADVMLAAAVDMETGMRGYLLAGIDEFLDPYKGGIETFDKTISTLKNTVSDNPAQVELLGEIEKMHSGWQSNVTEAAIALRREIGNAKSMNDMAALVGEARGKKYFDKFRGQIKTFIETEASLMGIRQADAEKTAKDTQKMVMIGTLLTIVIAALISFFLAGAITRTFKNIFQGLKSLSSKELEDVRVQFTQIIESLNSGAVQVANASQQMAVGASQQASSLEETSSSLEEMASMTKQNADNANQANSLMKEANQVVGQANGSMTELTGSMNDISKASEETSKIIKTIDEIAFQTNLLALNAAVEAARAGEAGAGFAVVADEVRNLAMRAADAAKDTAGLIEETVKKVNGGSELVARTNEAFTEVEANAGKVGQLVGEIAAASSEQAQGIEQINGAVTEMDKVVQANAASTEELSAQGEELNGQVGLLLEIVEGNTGNGTGKATAIASSTAGPEKYTPTAHKQIAAPRRDASPEQIIPLDEDDFSDF